MSNLDLDEVRSKSCLVCGRVDVDACHIRSKGAGGPDEAFNLYPACRTHHAEQHHYGWNVFLNRYPIVFEYLRGKGWELNDVIGVAKLWNPRLREGRI